MNEELSRRYNQAYTIVRASMKMAKVLRNIGFGLAALLAAIGLLAFTTSSAAALLCLFSAAIVGFSALGLYTLLVGQAQMMAAVCDTAVNTSPHFDQAEKLRIVEQIY